MPFSISAPFRLHVLTQRDNIKLLPGQDAGYSGHQPYLVFALNNDNHKGKIGFSGDFKIAGRECFRAGASRDGKLF